MVDARTGQTVRSMRDGAISPGGILYWAETSSGGTKTKVHVTDLVSGKDLRSFTVEGDLRPAGRTGTFSAFAGDGWVTLDGLRLALMSSPYKINGEWLTKLAVVNTRTGAMESSAEFRGQNTYGVGTFAPDGRSLFLEQYGEGGVNTRVYDLATGKLSEPTGHGLKATGFRTAAVLSPDKRWLFRLDAGSPTTNCTSTDGPACKPNAIAPHVVALDLSADAKRYLIGGAVLSPDGGTLYAAGHLGISAIDTAPLGTNAIWQQAQMFDVLSLSADGRRLYAVSNMSRTLVMIDTTTGEKLGEVTDLGYVSAIVRVDSR